MFHIEKYCDKLKEIKKNKEFEKKQILDNLFEAKSEWNYAKIKNYESKSDLILAELQIITLFHGAMSEKCPRENWNEESCINNCKGYYDYIEKMIKKGV